MKHILFSIALISISFISYSQRRDTFNLFQNSKKEKKDAVKEIQSHYLSKQDSILYIKYGKSQTKCNGYCYHESTIDSMTTVTESRPLQPGNNNPPKTETTKTNKDYWSMMIKSVQFNSFFSIPEKVGNPGVGDENSEWIEINYAGKIHKVTFDSTGPDEYEGINNLTKFLKKMTSF